jgi:integrase
VRDVPPALRQFLGTRRFAQSLQTHSLAEARSLRPRCLAHWEDVIAAARRGIVREWRLRNVGKAGGSAVLAEALTLRGELASAHQMEAADEDEAGGDNEDRTAQSDAVWDHAVERAQEITRGDAEARAFLSVVSGEATPLAEHLDRWLRETPFQATTERHHRAAVARFTAWLDAQRVAATAQAVTRKVAGDYVSHLAALHPHGRKTVNKHVSTLSTYWKWMERRGHASDIPWRGQQLPVKRPSTTNRDERERPFTDAEVARLLAGPCPRQEIADIIRLGALTGARIEELCRLRVADCAAGTFSIRASKTDAGVRNVPIHSDLAEIVARRVANQPQSAWLFHDIGEGTADGRRSDVLSKAFSRYRQDLGVHEREVGRRRSRVNFHSFRRWFVTAAEQAGQAPHIISVVTGHTEGRKGMTLSVYSGGPAESQLRACVEAVRLPAPDDGTGHGVTSEAA